MARPLFEVTGTLLFRVRRAIRLHWRPAVVVGICLLALLTVISLAQPNDKPVYTDGHLSFMDAIKRDSIELKRHMEAECERQLKAKLHTLEVEGAYGLGEDSPAKLNRERNERKLTVCGARVHNHATDTTTVCFYNQTDFHFVSLFGVTVTPDQSSGTVTTAELPYACPGNVAIHRERKERVTYTVRGMQRKPYEATGRLAVCLQFLTDIKQDEVCIYSDDEMNRVT